MKLDAWCKQNPDKVAKLRDQFGKQNLHRYRAGERIPDDEAMPEIAKLTGYQVTANDFYGIDPIRAAKAAVELAAA